MSKNIFCNHQGYPVQVLDQLERREKIEKNQVEEYNQILDNLFRGILKARNLREKMQRQCDKNEVHVSSTLKKIEILKEGDKAATEVYCKFHALWKNSWKVIENIRTIKKNNTFNS